MSSKANERHSNKPKLSMAFFAVSKQVSSSGCNQANRMCEGFRLDHDWITIDKDWQKTALYSLLKALTCEKPGERGQKNRVEVTSCIATAHRRQTREPRNCARARNVPVTKTAFLAARRTSFSPGARLTISADCCQHAHRGPTVFCLSTQRRRESLGFPPATHGPPCARCTQPPGSTTAATFRLPAGRQEGSSLSVLFVLNNIRQFFRTSLSHKGSSKVLRRACQPSTFQRSFRDQNGCAQHTSWTCLQQKSST